MRWGIVVFILGLTPMASIERVFAENPRYRVAVIIPLSGQVASMGGYVRNGIELAWKALPVEKRAAMELIYEDDQFDPPRTLSAYRRLSQVKPLHAVFVLASPPANALVPLTEQHEQILVSVGGSDPNIVKDHPYAFIHWVTPAVLGKKLADELLRREFRRMAFLTAEVTGGWADINAVVDEVRARNAGERIVHVEGFAKQETDYRAVIGALKQKRVDVIVPVLFAGSLSSFAKQAQQLRLGAELAGMETFEDEAEIKAAAGTLEGQWYVNAADPRADFVVQYKKEYGSHPGWAAANGYDALMLLADAVAAAKGENAGVREFLRGVKDYQGAAGVYSASGDNRFTLPAALKKVTENGFVTVERSDETDTMN